MRKLRIVLAEDEPKILRNTAKKIEAFGSDVELCGTAPNGTEGWRLVEELHPDLLITDIRMPMMDGLELARLAQQKYSKMSVVILSGYAEFEYARQAICFGVREYLIKPVVEDQLTQLLTRELQRCRSNSHYPSLQAFAAEAYPPPRYLLPLLLCVGNLPAHGSYTTASAPDMPWQALEENLPLPESLTVPVTATTVEGPSPNQRYLLWGSNQAGLYSDTPRIAVQMLHSLEQLAAPHKVHLAYFSAPAPTTTDTMLQQLAQTMEEQLVTSLSQAIDACQPAGSFPCLTGLSIQKSMEAIIESNKRAAFLTLWDSIFHQWQQNNYPQRKVESEVIHLTRQLYLRYAPVTEFDLMQIEQELRQKMASVVCYTGATAALAPFFDMLFPPETPVLDQSERLCEQIVQYCHDNYMQNITLDSIANYFNYSISYVIRVFKKHQKQTLMQYLTELRIQKAQELILNSPTLSMKDVAQLVGYLDQHYFSRIFKSCTGFAPSEYHDSQK